MSCLLFFSFGVSLLQYETREWDSGLKRVASYTVNTLIWFSSFYNIYVYVNGYKVLTLHGWKIEFYKA